MFIVVKRKTIVSVILIVGLIFAMAGTGVFLSQKDVFAARKNFVVVIDAGHGGADKGVVGKNGLIEAELNLEISLLLEKKLTDSGFVAVMTRKTQEGLYGDSLKNFKARDFAERKRIIAEADPDVVVSIHANKFPQSEKRRGIQVFYNRTSKEGKKFAERLQESLNVLNEKYVGKTFSPLAGEYFMLNCTKKPSVIIECGFLSNEEDEALLSSPEYKEELTDAILLGIMDHIGS